MVYVREGEKGERGCAKYRDDQDRTYWPATGSDEPTMNPARAGKWTKRRGKVKQESGMMLLGLTARARLCNSSKMR